jgi:uncharacterized protein YlxP (DUF503 family)
VSAVVALLTVEMYISGAGSLKEKRMVLRRVKDRLARFNVAVAEIEYQDLWQRAALGVVTVSNSEAHAQQELARVVDEIDRVEPGTVSRTGIEFLA